MKTPLLKHLGAIALILLTLGFTACESKDDPTTGGGSSEEEDDGGGGGGGGGAAGGAVLFDGSAEYLELSDTWYTGDFTICLWMKPDSVAGNTLLSMSTGDKYFYLSFDSNELDWKIEDSIDTDMNIDASTTFTVGNVYQVCVTGDHGGTGSRAYVNGAQVGGVPSALGASVAATYTTLTIGSEPAPAFQAADGNKTAPFEGTLDNIMIWTMVLPANAISQLYASGTGFDPQFAFSNYTITHVANLHSYYLMGDDPLDVIDGGSAVIKDTQGNEDLIPTGFENGDLTTGLW